MKTIRALAIVVIAAPILVGCGAADDPGASVSTSEASSPPALDFDPEAPLDAQMEAAIDAHDASLVEEILAAGYAPETELVGGLNALHVAAYASAADLVPILVEADVPLEKKVNGTTPLVVAVSFGDAETVTAFLEAGADVTVTNSMVFNAPPLHVAARWGNIEAIEALLAWGVPIDNLDQANANALVYAAYFGQYDAAMYLAEHGANLNQMDDFGDSPVVASERMGFPELADALRELGAEG